MINAHAPKCSKVRHDCMNQKGWSTELYSTYGIAISKSETMLLSLVLLSLCFWTVLWSGIMEVLLIKCHVMLTMVMCCHKLERRPLCIVLYCKWYYLLAEPYDRVMQLNWLYFYGILCQLRPLKLWSNTALDCNHQSTCMPQLQPLCSATLVPNVLLPQGGMKARVSPVQWSKPHSILVPTQDSNLGGRIQNHKRWPLHYHCTLNSELMI